MSPAVAKYPPLLSEAELIEIEKRINIGIGAAEGVIGRSQKKEEFWWPLENLTDLREDLRLLIAIARQAASATAGPTTTPAALADSPNPQLPAPPKTSRSGVIS